MLLNRAVEICSGLRLRQRLLRQRARLPQQRVPVILIPGMLGTRLLRANGEGVWNSTTNLYFGRPLSQDGEVRLNGLLEEFRLVPGLWSYDVYGRLLRFLERVGGYRRDEDLFVLDYDWRTGIADSAARLDLLVERIRGIGDEPVDLVGISTGGLVARYFLTYGGENVLAQAEPIPTGSGAKRVRRVVYVGTAQRGSLYAFEALVDGIRPAPLGRRFAPTEIARFQTIWDLLPHPSERVFVDDCGRPLEYSLYDPGTWARLGVTPLPLGEVGERLESASRLHGAFDRPFSHSNSFVVGARNLPTSIHAIVSENRVKVAPCQPQPNDPLASALYEPGDNSVPESSLRALPGLDEEHLWWAPLKAHHLLPSRPDVHRLILEALLALC